MPPVRLRTDETIVFKAGTNLTRTVRLSDYLPFSEYGSYAVTASVSEPLLDVGATVAVRITQRQNSTNRCSRPVVDGDVQIAVRPYCHVSRSTDVFRYDQCAKPRRQRKTAIVRVALNGRCGCFRTGFACWRCPFGSGWIDAADR